MTTQVPEEGLDLGVYEVGRAYAEHPGILKGGDMTTEALVAKTMWALGQTRDPTNCKACSTRPSITTAWTSGRQLRICGPRERAYRVDRLGKTARFPGGKRTVRSDQSVVTRAFEGKGGSSRQQHVPICRTRRDHRHGIKAPAACRNEFRQYIRTGSRAQQASVSISARRQIRAAAAHRQIRIATTQRRI